MTPADSVQKGSDMDNEPILQVDNLKTEIKVPEGVVRAVDGVTFSIRRGETLALVGESGSGKSMTSLSVIRLIPPNATSTAERLKYGTIDLLDLSKEEIRKIRGRRIAMIFQEPMTSLDPVYRVEKQIAEALEAHFPNLSKQQIHERAIEVLTLVGVPEPEKRMKSYPHQLSGGLRQRVMIGISLIADPELLIADEPTTALDATIQAQIIELISELQQSRQMSMLLITHDFAVVYRLAKRVAVMYGGKIVEEGSKETIFRKPLHPYTKALIDSIPGIKVKPGGRLETIPGSVPNPLNFPAGCRFHPRCGYAMPCCSEQEPPEIQLDDRRVSCFLYANEMKGNGE